MTPQEQTEADEREFIRRKTLFEPLVASAAWKELEGILLAQHTGQLQRLLAPPSLTDGAVAIDGLAQVMSSEYRKGVVFGIQLTLKTPHATIASANEIISARQEKEKTNARPSTSRPASVDDDGNRLPDTARVTDLSGGE
jgi:hypothetical protein